MIGLEDHPWGGGGRQFLLTRLQGQWGSRGSWEWEGTGCELAPDVPGLDMLGREPGV